MTIAPLKKEIYEQAIKLGITSIKLEFQGGSDEGHLNIYFEPYNLAVDRTFEAEVEDWAWTTYSYSGAGDGHDYGDNITYYLESKTATWDEWYTVVEQGDAQEILLSIEGIEKDSGEVKKKICL